jgi:hypothetical protein
LECCEQGTKADAPKQTSKTVDPAADPARQIVFRVEGLACPAVKGIGCGHMLQGVLASLDKHDGVEEWELVRVLGAPTWRALGTIAGGEVVSADSS